MMLILHRHCYHHHQIKKTFTPKVFQFEGEEGGAVTRWLGPNLPHILWNGGWEITTFCCFFLKPFLFPGGSIRVKKVCKGERRWLFSQIASCSSFQICIVVVFNPRRSSPPLALHIFWSTKSTGRDSVTIMIINAGLKSWQTLAIVIKIIFTRLAFTANYGGGSFTVIGLGPAGDRRSL